MGFSFSKKDFLLQKVIHIYVGLRNLIVMVKVGSGWSNPHGKWKKWPAVQKRTAVFSVSWVRDFQTVDYKSVRLFTIRSIFLEDIFLDLILWFYNPKSIRMQHCRIKATDGVEFWISCKRPAFLSSFGLLQVIQNKRPWCWNAAYVTAGLN